jgi:hypothetical protein
MKRTIIAFAITWLCSHFASADTVTDWNNVFISAVRGATSQANPGYASRAMGMLNIAMFDAINDTNPTCTPMIVSANGTGADPNAAAIQSAYVVLSSLYPSQSSMLTTQYNTKLAAIAASPAKTAGISLGNTVGNGVLANRASDGSNVTTTPTLPTGVGYWAPDPLNPGQTAWGPNWGNITPFAAPKSNFNIPAPPAINSPEYTTAYNQVKALGDLSTATANATRQTQTDIGHYWAYDVASVGPPIVLYDQILQSVANLKGNTLAQNARLFGLVGTAMADGGYAAWDIKYQYDYWRPITAIRTLNDGNADTVADANWTPVGAPGDGVVPDFTPPFPAYVSGHATFGAAMFQMLSDYYGSDQFTFTYTSDDLPGKPRTFTSFGQAAQENADSRVYLGIHWQFDADQGVSLGNQIANYVFSHAMLPAAVPEPSTFALVAVGFAALATVARRRSRD